jgi:fructose-1,6-bisphosphatase/inositol monophosphatase family enzyme
LAINRRLVLGIVSVPMIGHTYTAIKGKGAFLNGDQVTLFSDFNQTFRKGSDLYGQIIKM